ncbi:MAG: flagellar type III secretion system pore protein FliP [Armatimonadetes bacterium]|nr:flagellar type III secretion system pore protein FliP [Armatimonadota bacterium]
MRSQRRRRTLWWLAGGALCILLLLTLGPAMADSTAPLPRVSIGIDAARKPEDVSLTLQVLGLLTILSLAPAIVMMMTSFTRIVIVLGFTRSAIGTQQIPPNSVLTGLALFLTFFTMQPTLAQIHREALQPYLERKIPSQAALQRAEGPIRTFMFRQTRPRDLSLFVSLSRLPRPSTQADVPTYVVVPAFVVSELKTAFTMGFIIFLPFLVVDLVVSIILMSMGMMMLPPVLISLPFKILLFVMVDGWHLIVRSLALSFG